MLWNFPEIDPGRSWDLQHYIDKIKEEVREFQKEIDDFQFPDMERKVKELVDILHSSETLVRKFLELHPEVDIDSFLKKVIEKNSLRGYYTK